MARIGNIEVYLPEYIETNELLLNDFPDADFSNLEKKVGIKQRHIAGENETALDLAYFAAKKILNNVKAEDIDFLILCSQSPDYYLPTSACILQDRLALRKDIGALDFNLGCSGYIYGLALAKGLIAANIAKKILFVTSETYSKHIHRKDKANRSIFGDGATATIVDNNKHGIFEFELGTDGSGYDKLIVPNGCFRNKYEFQPDSFEYGSGNITDNNHLYMNGPEIFNFTIENIPGIVTKILDKNELTIQEYPIVSFNCFSKELMIIP